jgi:plastocyanin
MRFTTALATASLVGFVAATDFPVTVGAGGQLVFEPNNVTAAAGDTITFTFNPKNQWVVSSSA